MQLHTFWRSSYCANIFILIFYGSAIAQSIFELSVFNSFYFFNRIPKVLQVDLVVSMLIMYNYTSCCTIFIYCTVRQLRNGLAIAQSIFELSVFNQLYFVNRNSKVVQVDLVLSMFILYKYTGYCTSFIYCANQRFNSSMTNIKLIIFKNYIA